MSVSRERTVPVLIVGAGPAGAALGVLLGERDVPCVVLDRAAFPRTKPCGELLNPGAVCALARLGLLEAVLEQRPAQIRRWSIRGDGPRAAMGHYSAEAPWGLGLPRNMLDACLVSEARNRGVVIHERTMVRTAHRTGEQWVVDARGDDGTPIQWRADILVGADGLRSVIARRVGAVRPVSANKLSITCHVQGTGPDRRTGYLFRTRGRTVGIAPIHDHLPIWNVTVVVDTIEYAASAARDRMHLFWSIFEESGPLWSGPPTLVDGPWVSGGFRLRVSRPVTDTAVLVGDAAGYFDPFTGQGVQQALRSAELAAPAIDEAWRTRHQTRRPLEGYGAALRRERRASQVFQRGVEFLLHRDKLRGPVIAALRGAPGFADRVVQVAGDHRPLTDLFRVDELMRRGGRW